MRTTVALVILVLWTSISLAGPADNSGFGRSLHLEDDYAQAAPNPIYSVVPITVECRAKLEGKAGYNILVANEGKPSGTHWELYTDQKTGALSAFLPGYQPADIKSTRDVT